MTPDESTEFNPAGIFWVGIVSCLLGVAVLTNFPLTSVSITILSYAAFLTFSMYLIYQIFKFSDTNPKNNISKISYVSTAIFLLMPSLIFFLGTLKGIVIEYYDRNVNQIFVYLFIAIFIFAAILRAITRKGNKYTLDYILLPLSLFSFLLLLGSKEFFGFLVEYIPEGILSENSSIRLVIAAVIASAIFIDVALGFLTMRKSVAQRIASQRKTYLDGRTVQPIIHYEENAFRRFLSFAKYDLINLSVVAGMIFTTVVMIFFQSVKRSILSLWNKHSYEVSSIIALIFLVILMQSYSDDLLRSVINNSLFEGFNFATFTWFTLYVLWLIPAAALLLFQFREFSEKLSYSYIFVIFSFFAGVWISNIVVSVIAFLGLSPLPWINWLINPFTILGFLVVITILWRTSKKAI